MGVPRINEFEVPRAHVFGCIARVWWHPVLSSMVISHVLVSLSSTSMREEALFFANGGPMFHA